MALYAIADLHLSVGVSKKMDIFGGVWDGYHEKIKSNLSTMLTEYDTLVIAGDFSWGMTMTQALSDFRFIDGFLGKKIISKGNHDFWWDTVKKMKETLLKNDIYSVDFLNNNYFAYRDIAICGSRGWFFEEQKNTEHDKKMIKREVLRLAASLESAKADGFGRLCAFLHYPPVFYNYTCAEMIDVLKTYNVVSCYYGHLHGNAHDLAVQGTHDGINFRLISADYLGFRPVLIEK